MNSVVRQFLTHPATTLQRTFDRLRIRTMDDFENYIQRYRPEHFLYYRNASPQKRDSFAKLLDVLNIDLAGKSILDIGCGYGDVLDVAHDRGAKIIHFIDHNFLFYKFNRLKSFTQGFRLDHFRALSCLPSNYYDVVWAKGLFSADYFLSGSPMSKYPPLRPWLKQVNELAVPGGKIIITPHWLLEGSERRIDDVHHNEFTETMLDSGYTILPTIPGHDGLPQMPFTMMKVC